MLHLGLQIVIVALLVGAGDLLFGLEQEYVRNTGVTRTCFLNLSF